MFARESYKFRKLLFENRVFTDDQLRALIEAGDIATYDRVRRESMARFGHSRNIVAAEQILKISSIRKTLLTAAAFSLLLPCLHAQPTTVTVQAGAPGKRISPDLVGIFFEDLSFAADGGLYAELIQNRSFDYSEADHAGWTPLTAWQLVQRDGAQGSVVVENAQPLNSVNTSYALLTVEKPGGEWVCKTKALAAFP